MTVGERDKLKAAEMLLKVHGAFKFRRKPVTFVREILGAKPDEWQIEG